MDWSKKPPLGELKVGDTVWVRRSPNDMRRRTEDEAWIEVEITKASRVWIEMRKPGVNDWSIYTYRMRRDTQNEGSQYSGNNASFWTKEQKQWRVDSVKADRFLKEQGIEIRYGSSWSAIELAEVLASHLGEEL